MPTTRALAILLACLRASITCRLGHQRDQEFNFENGRIQEEIQPVSSSTLEQSIKFHSYGTGAGELM